MEYKCEISTKWNCLLANVSTFFANTCITTYVVILLLLRCFTMWNLRIHIAIKSFRRTIHFILLIYLINKGHWWNVYKYVYKKSLLDLIERLILNANKIVHMICFSSLLISWIDVKNISHLKSSNPMLVL